MDAPLAVPVGKRSIMLWIVVGIIFLLFLLFAWRVFAFYRQIQLGIIDPATYTFQKTRASGSYLASFASQAPGSGTLATQDDPSIGSDDPKLTIVYFADFGCPYSEEVSYVVDAVSKQFTNQVRFIYRDFPLTELHPGADLAAQAGECAEEQGRFWQMHDVLYANSGEYTAQNLVTFADDAGLDLPDFTKCLESGRYADEVQADVADGVAAGVVGTPTFFFNGQKVEGSIPFSVFNELVHAFLET